LARGVQVRAQRARLRLEGARLAVSARGADGAIKPVLGDPRGLVSGAGPRRADGAGTRAVVPGVALAGRELQPGAVAIETRRALGAVQVGTGAGDVAETARGARGRRGGPGEAIAAARALQLLR